MTEEQYRVQYDEDDAVGWDAIDAALETLYGDLEPRHYASIVKYATGGEVQFLQLVGLTQAEMDWLYQEPTAERCEALIARMRADNPLLITDLRRTKNYI